MPVWCLQVQACNAHGLLCRHSTASSPRRQAVGAEDSPQAIAAAAQAPADALRLEGEWVQADALSEAAQQLQQEADAPAAGRPPSLGDVLEHESPSASDHSHSTGAHASLEWDTDRQTLHGLPSVKKSSYTHSAGQRTSLTRCAAAVRPLWGHGIPAAAGPVPLDTQLLQQVLL